MHGAVIHAAHDVRYEEREEPRVIDPTDVVVRSVAVCVCGSDLWRYRGLAPVPEPTPIGHEYLGIVEQVGAAVTTVRPGQLVVGGFTTSCGQCPACRKGAFTSCVKRTGYDGCQAELIRVQNADGTLVVVPGTVGTPTYDPATEGDENYVAGVPKDLVPSLLALSDVACTGWHGAVTAGAAPGETIAVIGDGAVGICAVLAARQLGADRVIAMSTHADRAALARTVGATDVVAERGQAGADAVRAMTEGLGADGVVEAVGTEGAREQAGLTVRDGGRIGLLGVPHGDLPSDEFFWRNVTVSGGVAPVRAYIDRLLELVVTRRADPGVVFDLELPLAEVAEAYAAMDERRATKVLLRP